MTNIINNISISLRNLLWSTRGKDWGFRFVHKPESYPDISEMIYNSIFSKDDRMPLRWYGIASIPNGADINYVASRYYDPDTIWKDLAGRQIPHEMYLDIGSLSPIELICSYWEYDVMNQVRGYYKDVYNMKPETIQRFHTPIAELSFSLIPCSIEASRVDIRLGVDSDRLSSNLEQKKSIGSKVLKVLNTKL